jgi:hypothetical protein
MLSHSTAAEFFLEIPKERGGLSFVQHFIILTWLYDYSQNLL